MKILKTALTALILISGTFMACKKNATVIPETTDQSVSMDARILIPSIFATANGIRTFKGSSKLTTTFQSLTASYYGATLYAHTAASAAGPWSTGTLPVSYINPVAIYALPQTYLIGSTVYIFYSTNPGTTYPSGSASPIYSVVVS